ncbi:flagellar protein FlaG [Paenibacillus piri]|uniref:flagellar protein FlaG n=1 Tax=Paenibacillus piri TaxID=2547395 RepID=UPI001FE97908|nr:flagellar protein FlaG [Paenibacillus piri]
MSTHLPVNTVSPDWTAAVESTPKIKSSSSDTARTEPFIVASVNNISELKRAELKGEHISLSDEQMVKAIERAIKAMQGKSTSLEFSIHEKTRLISVKVKNNDNGEIIREIPPEKTLDFVAKLWEMAGILVDERR